MSDGDSSCRTCGAPDHPSGCAEDFAAGTEQEKREVRRIFTEEIARWWPTLDWLKSK